jgi:hypothetical protein
MPQPDASSALNDAEETWVEAAQHSAEGYGHLGPEQLLRVQRRSPVAHHSSILQNRKPLRLPLPQGRQVLQPT